jgi:phosphate transport system permease protein
MVVPMGGILRLAGAVALAVIVIPVVVRTTEDMLLLVPNRCARRRPRSACRARW